MLKNKSSLYNSILILYIGTMIIYLLRKPPTLIIKHFNKK